MTPPSSALGYVGAVVFLGICSAVAGQPDNLIPNPGFETLQEGKPLHWRFDHEGKDDSGISEEGRSGKYCVWAQLKENSSASWWSDEFSVQPDTTYDVEVRAKVDRPASSGSVYLGVAFDTHNAPYRSVVLTPGKWQVLTDTVRSWPKSQTARIRLLIGHSWEGKVWFDDVSFRQSKIDWMDRFPQTDLSKLRLGPQHPGAFFNPTEIEELRAAIETQPWAKRCYHESLKDAADGYVAESPFRLPEEPNLRTDSGRCKIIGLVYQLSQDRKYAQGVRERLLAYAERFPEGNLCRGDYSYVTGYALHDTAITYDLIYDSGVLGAADHEKIEAMLREGFAGMSRYRSVMEVNNRGAVCLGAMAAIAFCLQDRELVEWTINGPYGFNYHMHKGVGDDGLWIEGISYTYMALGGTGGSGYLSVAESAHHAGIDLYSHPRFKRLLNAPLEYAFPDSGLPANGHCSYDASLLGQQEARRYFKPWVRLRDPRYAWVISEGLKIESWLPLGDHSSDLFLLPGDLKADFSGGQAPTLTTTLFPQIGHAMLRSGEGENEICVLLDYGPFGSHGNPDKLSLTLYAHDNLLSPDGITGYWWPTTFLYECATIGHNTVVVDERTQFPTPDKQLNTWMPARRIKIVDAEDSEANLGVKMRRSLALAEGYLLDLFAVQSDEEHRYDWAYHNFGQLKPPAKLAPKAGTLGIRHGYQYITDVRRGEAEDTWSAEWDLNEMNLIWNSSFELQNGPAWQITGWRIPSSGWRPYVTVDPGVHRTGRQSLRVELPTDNKDSVYLLATDKRNRFRAGKKYLLEGYVRVSDARAAEGDVGLWIGDDLICRLSAAEAAAATARWVKISGLYEPRATNRDLVRIGLDNVSGCIVWFDDISLRIREDRANALRLTMLGCPGTEVIAADGEGLRPFHQPLIIARRKAKATVFASVLEPYYGEPPIRAMRFLTPKGQDGQTGVEVITDRSIDRFAVSYTAGRKSFSDLALEGMIGAVSVDRRTRALRYLCLGEGTYIEGGHWRLETTDPSTVYLEQRDGAYILQTWDTHPGEITIRGPGLMRDLKVRELNPEGRPAREIKANVTAEGVSFEVGQNRAYRLAE